MNRALHIERFDALGALGPERWQSLWGQSLSPSVFARYEWAEAWWECFGAAGELRLYAASAGDTLAGLLPLCRTATGEPGESRWVLVGDEHADYAALLLRREHPEALDRLLAAATADLAPGEQLLLRAVRDDTEAAARLAQVAGPVLGRWQAADALPCPRTSLEPARLEQLLAKQSLRRHARKLATLGAVEIRHWTEAADVLPRLERFFDQHIARWSDTPWPSLFLNPANRHFYRALAAGLAGTGALVFTEVLLDDRMVAGHFGFVSEGDFIWYKPSYDPAFARHSPGEVLLRALLEYAGARGLTGFDFTRGGEAFKRRFSDQERQAVDYLYCASRATALQLRARRRLRAALRRAPVEA